MAFAHPEYLWLLSGVPALAVLLYAVYRMRKQASDIFRPAKFRRAEKTNIRESAAAELVFSGGMLLAAALLAVAVAAPYQNNKPVIVPEGPVQAVFVVDVSRSMASEDYRHSMPADAGKEPDLNAPWGSRLQMAKYQMGKIMDAIAGNEVGLVTYTSLGFGQAMPSKDLSALRFVLQYWVGIGTAPGDGSNYANGINMALDMLQQRQAKDKQQVIVLLTDGGFTGKQEEIKKAAERLKKQGVKLVIVGLGMPGQNAIPMYENGALKGPMQVDGKTVTTSYEEQDIRDLLAMANGSAYKHIELDAQSQVVAVDWVTEISGSTVVYERRMLDRYVAGAAYSLIALLVLTGVFFRRKQP